MGAFRTLILYAIPILTIYILYIQPRIKKHKEVETVQDFLGKDVIISPGGLIQNGPVYRYAIEVTAVNNDTSSFQEQSMIWANFRNLINVLPYPHTLLVQSQFLDMKDYSDGYRDQYLKNTILTDEMRECGEEVYRYYKDFSTEDNTRDYRYYVILNYNPTADNIDSGVKTGVNILDDLIGKSGNSKKKMPLEEVLDLAQQVLEESKSYLFTICDQMGMQYRQLDRAGVYQMTYQMLQKELSVTSRLRDAIESQSFAVNVESLTKRQLQNEFGGGGIEYASEAATTKE